MSRTKNEGNWLDRGGPPEPVIVRVLAYYLGLDPDSVGTTLDAHASAIRGMVEADASEIQLASYMRQVEADSPLPPPEGGRRATAVSLWHIVKAAAFRDNLLRLHKRWVAEHPGNSEPLSEWLADRIVHGPGGAPAV